MSAEIKFRVPVGDRSLMVMAQRAMMADLREGLHSFSLAPPSCDEKRAAGDDACHGALNEAVTFLNRLIDGGVPWSLLTTCRNGNGTLSAVIEAGHNRLNEIVGTNDAA